MTEPRIAYDACPLCASTDFAEYAVADCTGYPSWSAALGATQRWMRCRACTHEFVDGYFTDAALAILFAHTHATQQGGADIETARYASAKILESVAPFRTTLAGRWLDVGFGNGSLLATADEFGWTASGLDLREDTVRRMRDAGFDVHALALAAFAPAEKLDVISMCDVLEHVPFPKRDLERAHALLRDDGLLVLSMPNADAFVWKSLTLANANPYFAELEHYHNFGRRRLYLLLEECGFEPIRYTASTRYRACMDVIARRVPRRATSTDPIKLNIGCGRSPIAGWVNLDSFPLPGVDVVCDLETGRLPFDDNSVAEIAASHVIEHITNALPLMAELHRVAAPGARAVIRVPYGSSDDADEDPTHVRRYFWSSWGYFSQPFYWRADYGYRGDWQVEDVVLVVPADVAAMEWAAAMKIVQRDRNVVSEMIATLVAIKPARLPDRALQKQTLVTFRSNR